ncbi:dihydroxyacetone kinase DhaL subunit [Sinobaca qinghaiensis]|uniref:phosphoenolpyruvate--glycerone phosphotransferase n=1 Tax=Sinobaca qinghaiensis TaxID=342944 RepID=A0A419V4Y6_9BACL|nr:dihydroxyacetone kinase subunit DhaL [Sinobaca qinghaiensis]RKD73587.1 dihydroxyacetone kinase DhaL subunit [Sinobaca qinghaiensis]
MNLTTETAKQWLLAAGRDMQENKGYLSELDQAIGDGDHGHNMARGFAEVEKKIASKTYDDVGGVVKDASMTIISKVGGAAGPLYGTAFLKASGVWKGKAEVSDEEFAEGLKAAIDGIAQRGKSEQGQKTMLDVWIPVLQEAEKGNIEAEQLAQTAKEAMEKTEGIEAKKGRAAYLGERSIGHLDPGAYSSYLLFEALVEAIEAGGEANG